MIIIVIIIIIIITFILLLTITVFFRIIFMIPSAQMKPVTHTNQIALSIWIEFLQPI